MKKLRDLVPGSLNAGDKPGKLLHYLLLATLSFYSCEKEVPIELHEGEEKIVVDGHIEPELPPYVILTRSQPFFSSTSLSDIQKLFVHNAVVIVSDGATVDTLQELRSTLLPDTILDIISETLGINLANSKDTTGLELYVYTTIGIRGVSGRSYSLSIEAEGRKLSAVTTIPVATPIDSLWWVPHPYYDYRGILYVRYSDPPGENNYVRYFTKTNSEPFYPPFFKSTLDDKTLLDVDGKTFDFPIEKGHNRNGKIDIHSYTYFDVQDTVFVRWCAIDKAHFDFWSTAEFDRASTGNPFSSPTRIKTNINGGLGIWGGYHPRYYQIFIR